MVRLACGFGALMPVNQLGGVPLFRADPGRSRLLHPPRATAPRNTMRQSHRRSGLEPTARSRVLNRRQQPIRIKAVGRSSDEIVLRRDAASFTPKPLPEVERQHTPKARFSRVKAMDRKPRQRRIWGEGRGHRERDAQVSRDTPRVSLDIASLRLPDRAIGVEDTLGRPNLPEFDRSPAYDSFSLCRKGRKPLRCDVAVGRGKLVVEVDHAGHALTFKRDLA